MVNKKNSEYFKKSIQTSDKMMSKTKDVKKKKNKIMPNKNLVHLESHWTLYAKLLISGLDNKHNLMY